MEWADVSLPDSERGTQARDSGGIFSHLTNQTVRITRDSEGSFVPRLVGHPSDASSDNTTTLPLLVYIPLCP